MHKNVDFGVRQCWYLFQFLFLWALNLNYFFTFTTDDCGCCTTTTHWCYFLCSTFVISTALSNSTIQRWLINFCWTWWMHRRRSCTIFSCYSQGGWKGEPRGPKPLQIFRVTKTRTFSTTTKSRSVTVVLDSVLGLDLCAWWCPCFFADPETTYAPMLKVFDGNQVSSKSPSRHPDRD